nr:MauE/DoxX family redox-associated membrane protein [uncultured Dyadobacter sp.]
MIYSLRKQRQIWMVAGLLIVLFTYTGISKLLNLDEFERELARQTLPGCSKQPLLWLIPATELIVAGLLVYRPTRQTGFYGSALLMLLFTGYMGLVLLNFFDRVPCSCGGVIKEMGFATHFVFNLIFLALSILGIYMYNPRRKEVKWH